METKVCKKCGIEKILKDGFPKSRITTNGTQTYRNTCKECRKKRLYKWRKDNPEKFKSHIIKWHNKNKEHTKKWREDNKEHLKAYQKKWRDENREYARELVKKYRKENIDKIKKYKKENKDKFNKWRIQYEKEKIKTDPIFRLKKYMRGRLNSIIDNQGYSKRGKTTFYLGCNYVTLKKHIENQFINKMSWRNHGKWHLDHIIPLSSAENEGELKALFHYKNLQPLWKTENLIKHDSYDPKEKEKYLEWYSKNVKPLK